MARSGSDDEDPSLVRRSGKDELEGGGRSMGERMEESRRSIEGFLSIGAMMVLFRGREM